MSPYFYFIKFRGGRNDFGMRAELWRRRRRFLKAGKISWNETATGCRDRFRFATRPVGDRATSPQSFFLTPCPTSVVIRIQQWSGFTLRLAESFIPEIWAARLIAAAPAMPLPCMSRDSRKDDRLSRKMLKSFIYERGV